MITSMMSTQLLRVIVEPDGRIRGEPLVVTVVGVDDGAVYVTDLESVEPDVWPTRFDRVGAEWINPLDSSHRLIPAPGVARVPTPRPRAG